MNTKYDWSNVPSEVKWIETDVKGIVTGWKEKPVQADGCFYRSDWKITCADALNIKSHVGDWKDSLEQRPLTP